MLEPGEHLLEGIVAMLLCILLLGYLLKHFRQPYFSAYILAGILLGPHGLKLFTDVETIGQLGALGLIIQMFFIGAEIEVPALVKNLRVSIVGLIVQIMLSVLFTVIVGLHLQWQTDRIVLFTFVVSLSSSAIIMEYLRSNKEINSRLGSLTTGILILQDFLIVPMVLTLNLLGNREPNPEQLIPGIAVTVLFLWLMRMVVLGKKISIPQLGKIQHDHELQVFLGLLLCFGFAWITSSVNLSAAMGAMFAGILISQTKAMQWLDKTLVPFRVFFLSLFFMSVGLQLDVPFIIEYFPIIALLVMVIFVINSFINACVFRLLKESWKNSVYAGALLSQIGEFSLVLCTVAKALNIVDDYEFQVTLAVVSLTMMLSSVWISVIRSAIFNVPPVNRGE